MLIPLLETFELAFESFVIFHLFLFRLIFVICFAFETKMYLPIFWSDFFFFLLALFKTSQKEFNNDWAVFDVDFKYNRQKNPIAFATYNNNETKRINFYQTQITFTILLNERFVWFDRAQTMHVLHIKRLQ